jgi:hypothetical protein
LRGLKPSIIKSTVCSVQLPSPKYNEYKTKKKISLIFRADGREKRGKYSKNTCLEGQILPVAPPKLFIGKF